MGSSDEGECISVYTFFSIKDRNRSWLNQRGQTHGVIIQTNVEGTSSESVLKLKPLDNQTQNKQANKTVAQDGKKKKLSLSKSYILKN